MNPPQQAALPDAPSGLAASPLAPVVPALLADGMDRRFAPEGDFAALSAHGQACLACRAHEQALALAWALRQVNSVLAARLAQQALEPRADAAGQAIGTGYARLVLAEAAWLAADLAAALEQLQQAERWLLKAGGSRALSDLHWLRSQLVAETGDRSERDAAIQHSILHARAAGDSIRERYGLLAQACLQAMDEGLEDEQLAGAPMRLVEESLQATDAGTRMLAHLERQHHCSLRQDAPGSIRHGEQARLAALACGQWRRAILVSSNQGLELFDLQALESALAVLEASLPLARQCAWPLPLAAVLHALAQCLCVLDRHAAAEDFAREGLQLTSGMPRSRVHLLLQLALAEALLGTPARAGEAHALLQALQQAAQAIDDESMLRTAWYGLARALMLQGQPQAAWPLAQASLEQACKAGDMAHAVLCLRLQARLAACVQPDLQAAATPRTLLAQACTLLPAPALALQHELLRELAEAQQAEGEAAAAGDSWRKAYEALKAQRSQAFMLHAAALEVRLRTEHAQTEARLQRALAEEEHRRAAALDRLNAELQQALGDLRATQSQLMARNMALDTAYQKINELSLTDPLTQLHNRRYFDAVIERRAEEVRANAQGDQVLLFFMVDLDHFKEVNDAHGHAAGDMVLVQFAQRLRSVARAQDHLVRWGGEEFLLLLHAAARQDATAVAQRLLSVVAAEPFVLPNGQPLALTCSVGFSAYPAEEPGSGQASGGQWRDALARADERLYEAKRSGRNRALG